MAQKIKSINTKGQSSATTPKSIGVVTNPLQQLANTALTPGFATLQQTIRPQMAASSVQILTHNTAALLNNAKLMAATQLASSPRLVGAATVQQQGVKGVTPASAVSAAPPGAITIEALRQHLIKEMKYTPEQAIAATNNLLLKQTMSRATVKSTGQVLMQQASTGQVVMQQASAASSLPVSMGGSVSLPATGVSSVSKSTNDDTSPNMPNLRLVGSSNMSIAQPNLTTIATSK